MSKSIANIIFTLFIFLLFTFAAIESLTFSRLAQFFPLYISIAGSAVSLIYLIKIIIDYRKENSEEGNEAILIIKPIRYIGWIIGYLLMIYVFGMILATGIFLFIFLIYESRMKVLESALSVAVVIVAISYLSSAINIAWPGSLLGI